MKFVRHMRYLAFIPLFCFLWYIATSGTAFADSHQLGSSVSPQTYTVYSSLTKAPAWIARAQPYVHISHNMAIVDTAISHYLSVDDIINVNVSVAHYNGLPASVRDHPSVSGIGVSGSAGSRDGASAMIPDGFAWEVNWYWWGLRVWVNSDLANALGAGSAVPAALLAIVPPMAFTVVVYGAAIVFDNYMCSSRGVFLDFPYLPPGTSHPTPVC
jgi:hypothetical protein